MFGPYMYPGFLSPYCPIEIEPMRSDCDILKRSLSSLARVFDTILPLRELGLWQMIDGLLLKGVTINHKPKFNRNSGYCPIDQLLYRKQKKINDNAFLMSIAAIALIVK